MTLHLLRILELLHEARMFPYSRNVEGLHLGADGEDEVVIGYRRVGDRALDLRGIREGDGLVHGLRGMW